MARSKTPTGFWKSPGQMPGGKTRWATIQWSASGKETSDCLSPQLPLAFFLFTGVTDFTMVRLGSSAAVESEDHFH